MIQTALDRSLALARQTDARVVFPEWDDPRMSQAARRLANDGICTPLPVTDMTEAQLDALVTGRGLKEPIARRMLTRPLFRAAAMVAAGEAEAMVAGLTTPTKRVIEAASLAIGLAPGVTQPSSAFLMIFPDGREMIFADCAVTVDPDAEALTAIALASAITATALLGQARVALLSYATGTSGTGDSVDRVRAAAQATGFQGPVQADAALNPRIAAAKGAGPDTSPANTLIFPDLNAGNIGYKLAQELAGAQALGPILQGFNRPVCDLSRGASVTDIVNATAVTLALA